MFVNRGQNYLSMEPLVTMQASCKCNDIEHNHYRLIDRVVTILVTTFLVILRYAAYIRIMFLFHFVTENELTKKKKVIFRLTLATLAATVRHVDNWNWSFSTKSENDDEFSGWRFISAETVDEGFKVVSIMWTFPIRTHLFIVLHIVVTCES